MWLWLSIALADNPRILGGEASSPGAWPAVVALLRGDDLVCTGTLIAPDLVLTAAHCSAAERVLLDTVDLDGEGTERTITDFVTYPQWTTTLDLAWVRLDAPVTTAPASLALDCVAQGWVVDDAPAVITGWGTQDAWSNTETRLLFEANVPIHDSACTQTSEGCNAAVSPGGELTAGGGGVDTCVGDSGGGLWVEGPDGWVLAAVTSRGKRPLTEPCGQGGIYGRVDAALDWLTSDAGFEPQRPECGPVVINQPPTPEASALIVPFAGQRTLLLDPADPDAEDSHTYALLAAPSSLAVRIDDAGLLTATHVGATASGGLIRVHITDDGTPQRSGEARVFVSVQPEPPGGCSTTGGGSGAWALVLLIVTSRRR